MGYCGSGARRTHWFPRVSRRGRCGAPLPVVAAHHRVGNLAVLYGAREAGVHLPGREGRQHVSTCERGTSKVRAENRKRQEERREERGPHARATRQKRWR